MTQEQEILKKLEELKEQVDKQNQETALAWNKINYKINKIAKHLNMDMEEFMKGDPYA
ncbi:MAG: hypothetical protein PHN88_13450 [Ignavibacteria bacterium]|nr:hypothetical protein [Ignavibacteria bacterium]